MAIRIFLIAAFSFFANIVFAEEYVISKQNHKDGEPNDLVYNVYKDRDGILWLGTEYGLSILQKGSIFKLNTNSKPLGGPVYCITEDSFNNIWLAIYGKGISIYNKKLRCFYNYPIKILGSSVITNMTPLGDSLMRITSLKGTITYNYILNSIKSDEPLLVPTNKILSIDTIDNKIVYSTNNGGLYILDGPRFSYLAYPKKMKSIINIIRIKNELFFTTYEGIYIMSNCSFSKMNIKINQEDMSNIPYVSVYTSGNNELLLSNSKYGLINVSRRNQKFIGRNLSKTNNWFGEDNTLYSSYYDYNSECYYLGSKKGFFEIKKQLRFIEKVNHIDGIGDVRSIIVNKNYFLGTEKNFILYKDEGQSFKKINGFLLIMSMLQLQRKIVIGANNLYIYQNSKIKEVKSDKVKFDNVTSILPIDSSLIILNNASASSFIIFDVQKEVVIDEIKNDSIDTYGFSGIRYNDSIFIFGSHTGGIELNLSTRKIQYIKGLENILINDISKSDSVYYIATQGNGILELDKQWKVSTFMSAEQLDNVQNLEYINGNIWYAKDNIMGVINTNSSIHYEYISGRDYSLRDFQNNSKYILGDNLYFGGENGFVNINTGRFIPDTIESKLFLVDFSYLNSIGENNQIDIERSIELQHNQNYLTFLFISTNIENSRKSNFEFRLSELDTWKSFELKEKLKLSNLSHGDYKMQIRKDKTNIAYTINFTILPPWYKSTLFFIIISIVSLGIIFWITRLYYQESLIKKQKEIEKYLEIQSERERISSEMHDDLGSGLSSIKLASEMVRRKSKDEGIKEEITYIVERATEMTNAMKELIWNLNLKDEILESFFSFTEKNLYELFNHSEINIKIGKNFTNGNLLISANTRRQLHLVIKEAINNIIKHSKAKNVMLYMKEVNSNLTITIKDDGVGINEKLPKGNGYYTMQKRIANLNGSLRIVNEKGVLYFIDLKL